MNSRERILAAINFTGPDRCPIHHYCFPGALWRHGQKLLDLVDKYPDDFGNEAINANWDAYKLADDQTAEDIIEYDDGWGTIWRRMRGYTAGEVHRPGRTRLPAGRRREQDAEKADSESDRHTRNIPKRSPDVKRAGRAVQA